MSEAAKLREMVHEKFVYATDGRVPFDVDEAMKLVDELVVASVAEAVHVVCTPEPTTGQRSRELARKAATAPLVSTSMGEPHIVTGPPHNCWTCRMDIVGGDCYPRVLCPEVTAWIDLWYNGDNMPPKDFLKPCPSWKQK